MWHNGVEGGKGPSYLWRQDGSSLERSGQHNWKRGVTGPPGAWGCLVGAGGNGATVAVDAPTGASSGGGGSVAAAHPPEEKKLITKEEGLELYEDMYLGRELLRTCVPRCITGGKCLDLFICTMVKKLYQLDSSNS
ncbi:Hypothetical predicted protein [Olea europaea subsp. europaea]|uniref:Uncharacterized protein n=1 Tax=Olea europaea subsp. europaea TaxID=158383 RepID=A0A8S0P680_OLEEU|nr:Hypothetical predicted protein [Olea europaea subsp. europaea]